MCHGYETLDQTPTRNGLYSQNELKSRYYTGLYLLKPLLRSFDPEIDILTLKMKLNH